MQCEADGCGEMPLPGPIPAAGPGGSPHWDNQLTPSHPEKDKMRRFERLPVKGTS